MNEAERNEFREVTSAIAEGGANAVLPASLLAGMDAKLVTFFQQLVLSSIPEDASSTLQLAGDKANDLQSSFFKSTGLDAVQAGRLGKIFKVKALPESVVAQRLFERSLPVAAGLLAEAGGEPSLASNIPAMMLTASELDQLKPGDKLRYLARVTQIVLLAAQLTDEEVQLLLHQMGIDTAAGRRPLLSAASILSAKAAEAIREAAFSRSA